MKQKTEEYVPLGIEDFEVGDRIYRYLGFKKRSLGRVESVHDNFVLVEMDDGTFEPAGMAFFDQDSPHWEWDKLINIDDIEVGSKLSRMEWGIRLFAEVESYVEGEEMVLRYVSLVEGKEPTRSVFKKPAPETGLTFEDLLLGWQLEG